MVDEEAVQEVREGVIVDRRQMLSRPVLRRTHRRSNSLQANTINRLVLRADKDVLTTTIIMI
jgi:hypothetical protein